MKKKKGRKVKKGRVGLIDVYCALIDVSNAARIVPAEINGS